jgi:hypothetical protein
MPLFLVGIIILSNNNSFRGARTLNVAGNSLRFFRQPRFSSKVWFGAPSVANAVEGLISLRQEERGAFPAAPPRGRNVAFDIICFCYWKFSVKSVYLLFRKRLRGKRVRRSENKFAKAKW